jgi:hypothetical protein
MSARNELTCHSEGRAESAFSKRARRTTESGYALLLILFLLALLVVSAAAIAPTVLANIQREKEAEMVWRGKQYIRGIRMYYVKMHRFPTALDDLTKPKTGLRFMRQAYKDPMNMPDGTWRLIYVGPNGQLIGSLKSRSIGGPGVGVGTPAGQAGTAFGSSSSFGGNSSFGNNSASGNSSAFNSSFGAASGNSSFGQSQSSFGGSGFGNSNTSSSFGNSTPSGAFSTAPADSTSTGDPNAPNVDNGDLPPNAMNDSPTIMGGNIIGIGSKVNKKSFKWYDKAKNYRLFEFIWDPSKDFTVGGASQGIGQGIGTPLQSTGQQNSPFSQNPSAPFSTGTGPGQTPSQPPPNQYNPNPDPNQNPPLQAPNP